MIIRATSSRNFPAEQTGKQRSSGSFTRIFLHFSTLQPGYRLRCRYSLDLINRHRLCEKEHNTSIRGEENTVIRHIINDLFHLDRHETTIKTELTAGVATFMAMAYIIFVNPAMLADAGMPREAAFAATVWGAAATSIFMGLWANMPVALAPGMGINAFFAYTVVNGMGLPWQTALGAVFISGVVFFLLSITKLRERIIQAVPLNLKLAISVGIGMFIAFIGLKSAGIIVDDPAMLIAFGNMKEPATILALAGLLVTGTLMALQIRGAILVGILFTTVAGMVTGTGPVPHGSSEVLSLDIPSFMPTFLQLDIVAALKYGLFSVLFTMTMVDLFDTMGTLIGLSRKAGLMKKD